MTALASAIEAATLDRIETGGGFDAIVVGCGAAGGMASMLLTQAGMRVLALDAGWRPSFLRAPIRRLTASMIPQFASARWLDMLPLKLVNAAHKGLKLIGKMRQPVQSKCFSWAFAPDAFVDDREFPYQVMDNAMFDWFRSHQLGGRMVVPEHGRQYYRLGPRDLAPDDGLSASWPLGADELDPWYAFVEDLLGLSGRMDGGAWLPDSRVRTVLEPSPAEVDLHETLRDRWPGVEPVLGRFAPPLDTLTEAAKTGQLLCRTGAVAYEVKVDGSGRACGVNWFDRASGLRASASAPIVFLCASALESTRILLMSRSPKSPDGLGARSDALGRYLMDHVVVTGQGVGRGLPGEPVRHETGRCTYVPRFDLRNGAGNAGSRGYGVQLYRWSTGAGRSYFNAVSFAEMIPRKENRVVLDSSRRDICGTPVLKILCRHSPEELAASRDQAAAIREVAALTGVTLDRVDESAAPPGTAIHECGTARMGLSPGDSVLDPNNECWDAKGLYVTDAAAFPTQGAQNPTLTILALTARACSHAVRAVGGESPWTARVLQTA